LAPHPTFCGQNPLDTQNPSSYTSTVKKQCLINKANLAICLSALALFGLCPKMYAAPFAYVPNSSSNNVSIIDTGTNKVVTTVLAGTTPYGVATVVSPTETFALITNVGSNNVSVIRTFEDLTSDTVVFQKLLDVPVGRGPHGIAADPARTFAYVTNSTDGTVSKIDLSNYNVAATITVGSNPLGIVVTPDGTSIYVVNNSSGTVSVIRAADNTIIVTVPVGISPFGIAVNPAGTFVYVANSGDNSVSIIKTADNSVITHYDIHFATPTGVAVNPAGTLAYITNTGSASVSLFDTATNTVSSPNIIVGVNPFGVSLNTLGTFTYVVNSSGSTISVIDNSTNTEKLPRITVGALPRALGSFIAPFGSVPTVTSTTPANAATDVSLGTTIQATFSDDMKASTINSSTFLVSGGATGTVTYNSATKTATFTPSLNALIKNTTYTATLTTGITNLAGTALSTNFSWSFTTSGEDNANCFIATAVYGSYDDVHVQILRRFRDQHLLPHVWGATLVDIYYRYSPSIADFIRAHNFLRKPVLWTLTPVVYFVHYPSHLAWIVGLGLIITIVARKQWLRLRK